MADPNTFGALTWGELTGTTGADRAGWQRWLDHNQTFFATPGGRSVLQNIIEVRQRFRAGAGGRTPQQWTALVSELRGQFDNIRARVQQNIANPSAINPQGFGGPGDTPIVPPGSPGKPGAAPTAAAVAPPPTAAAVAPPVYLPTVNAPNYMFPSAEAVRDMTYSPGLGGFLRPNQWQPGVPASPYGPPPQGPSPGAPYLPPTAGFGPPGSMHGTPGPGYTQLGGPGTPWWNPGTGTPYTGSDKKYD